MTNSTSSICSGCCTHCRWTAALNQFMTRFWRCSQSGPHWLPCWFTCSFPNLISRSGKILVRIQSLPTPPNSAYTLQTAEAVFFVLPAMLMFGHILPGHEKVAKLCTNLLWEYYTFHGWIYLDFFSTPNKSHISSIFMCCIACIPRAITFVSTVQIMILL